ncbi:MAG TPA: copper amine oxidase [Paenibacillus lactis]|nr:copper amine oxidase [Paenibacillus lactis]
MTMMKNVYEPGRKRLAAVMLAVPLLTASSWGGVAGAEPVSGAAVQEKQSAASAGAIAQEWQGTASAGAIAQEWQGTASGEKAAQEGQGAASAGAADQEDPSAASVGQAAQDGQDAASAGTDASSDAVQPAGSSAGAEALTQGTETQGNKLVISTGSASYIFNGKPVAAAQKMMIRKGYSYVPVSTMAKLYGWGLSYDAKTKEAVVKGSEGEWRFKNGSSAIRKDGSTVRMDAPAITYRGSMMVPVRSWAKLTGSSLAVTGGKVTLTWGKRSTAASPPVADFTTDKIEYRLGEPVVYRNTSHDPKYKIVKETWKGNEPAFFTPGEHEVTLEVINSEGVSASVRKTVNVVDEWLYTKEQYDRLYTPVGNKFDIDGASVLMMDEISYSVTPDESQQFIRSNSPEHLTEEGIAYEDTLTGNVRINIHNQNRSKKDLNVYLIATNPGTAAASVKVGAAGIGGPAQYVSTSGKAAVTRYLEALSSGGISDTVHIPAGESAVLLQEGTKLPLKPSQVRTIYADLELEGDIKLSVVAADPTRDPVAALKELPVLPRDGKHVRGTFTGADREVQVDGVVGESPQRLVLGDPSLDGYLEGVDAVTGEAEKNIGNTGVLYSMSLKVAPNTLVALNARGGHYAGALLVNGEVVQMTSGSILKNSSEAGVLYRTGAQEETVRIGFIPASGSNLPVHMLFMPLSEQHD